MTEMGMRRDRWTAARSKPGGDGGRTRRWGSRRSGWRWRRSWLAVLSGLVAGSVTWQGSISSSVWHREPKVDKVHREPKVEKVMRNRIERLRRGDVAKIVVAVVIYGALAVAFVHSFLGWVE